MIDHLKNASVAYRMAAFEGYVSLLDDGADRTFHVGVTVHFDQQASNCQTQMAAEAMTEMALGPDGRLRAGYEQVFEDPFVIVFIFVVFAIQISILVGVGLFWHDIEKAKEAHPDQIGYGHWYFSLIPRIWITAVAIVLVVLIGIIGAAVVFGAGPLLAEAYFRGKSTAATVKYDNQQRNVLNRIETARLRSIEM